MPRAFRGSQTLNTGKFGDPDLFNETPPTSTSITHWYRQGELGALIETPTGMYQMVQLDSGATSATSTGVVAANQLAFWKDKTNYLVTNDDKVTQGRSVTNAYANFVAGVFRTAVTAGNVCFVLQKATNAWVKAAASTCRLGGDVVATLSAPHTASADTPQAIGTFAGAQVIGKCRSSAYDTARFKVDLDIPPAE